jgi:hypothetical protein
MNSYDTDRYNDSGNGRNYRDTSYQQQRNDNYNNQSSRRSNNYSTGNGNRGHRGAGGGKFDFSFDCFLCFEKNLFVDKKNQCNNIYLHR